MLNRLKWGALLGVAFGGTMAAVVYGADLGRYVVFGLKYGDWMNDWLTHLPQFVQAIALHIVHTGG